MDLNQIRAELHRLASMADGWRRPQDIAPIERDLMLARLRDLYESVAFGPTAERSAPEIASSSVPVPPQTAEVGSGRPQEGGKASFEPQPEIGTKRSEPVAAAAEPTAVGSAAAEVRTAETAEPSSGVRTVRTLFGEDEAQLRHRRKQRVIMSLYDTAAPRPASTATEDAAVRNSEPIDLERFTIGSIDRLLAEDPAAAPAPELPVTEEKPVGTQAAERPTEALPEEPAIVEACSATPVQDILPATETAEAQAVAEEPIPVGEAEAVVAEAAASERTASVEETSDAVAAGEPASEELPEAVGASEEPVPDASSPVGPTVETSAETVAAEAAAQDGAACAALRSDIEAEPCVEPAPEPEPRAEVEPDSEPCVEASAAPVSPAADAQAEAADAAEEASLPAGSEEAPAAPSAEAAPVLGEVIVPPVQTLADTFAAPHETAADRLRHGPIADLRHAVGINDKFLLIRDLFDGNGALYEITIRRLDEFDSFDDCMIYIAEHFAWNPDSDGAKLMMELLERKFA